MENTNSLDMHILFNSRLDTKDVYEYHTLTDSHTLEIVCSKVAESRINLSSTEDHEERCPLGIC